MPFAPAAMAASTNADFHVRYWQSDDGLPNNTINGIAQTPDGFLWIASPNRLARFDGVRFESFALTAIGAHAQQVANTLLTDHEGALWVGLDHGQVIRLDAGDTRCFSNGLPDLYAQTLTEDGAGAIWITFNRGTACRIKDGKTTQFTEADGWPAAPTASLARDDHGRIWYAKAGQLGIFRTNRFETLYQLPRPAARVLGARAGGVWVACGPQLFRCVEGGPLSPAGTLEPDSPDTETTAMIEDQSGAVWIGTRAGGLFRFANSRFECVTTSHRQILCLAEDREGNIWAGTAGGGLNRIRPRTIQLEDTTRGLPFETLRSVCETAGGELWAATGNGLLIRRTGEEWKIVSAQPDWPGGAATCVAAGPDGAIWIGTQNRAIHCWRDDRFTSLRQTNGLTGRATQALLFSQTGDLWIGQSVADSLLRWRNGKLTAFTLPPNVHVIQAMVEDAAGTIWIGTSGGKLLRVDGDAVVDETGRTTNAPSIIRCLCATADGSLWIGYGGTGLGRLKDGRFRLIGAEQGLTDETISQLICDAQSWLWFGADHGLFKVRLTELAAVAEGRAARVRSIHYGRDEGLNSLQAEYGRSPGALRGRDGRLWMPMRTGLVVIDPDKLPERSEAPPVLIRRVAVDDRTVALHGGALPVPGVLDSGTTAAALRLQPGHRRLEFEFTAPTLAAPQNVFFRYRLDGFDDNWNDAPPERRATYSRLSAGNYRFQVQDCNTSGVWNEPGAGLAFSVAPFFWQTWWSRMLSLATLTAGLVGVVRYLSYRRLLARLRTAEQQAALERERARIARDIHDDLGNRLTKVMLLSGLAVRDRDSADRTAAHVEQISSTVRQATDALDEIVWAINPQNDTLPHLVNYLGQFAVEFLRTANIRCRADLPDHPPHEPVPADVRHNLFLIMKESLNNIVRHAAATEVSLRVGVDDGSVTLIVEDNGRGFEEESLRDGANGLRNMRQRCGEIGGELQITSTPGKGTKVMLKVRRPRSDRATS
jgi:signal transduction histidine kinase/ligand-binding sensor domain-containing protein